MIAQLIDEHMSFGKEVVIDGENLMMFSDLRCAVLAAEFLLLSLLRVGRNLRPLPLPWKAITKNILKNIPKRLDKGRPDI